MACVRRSSLSTPPGRPPRRRPWAPNFVRNHDPVLPFDSAAGGQIPEVRSARPLLIMDQLVLFLIIAHPVPPVAALRSNST
jgi:hypothetical protein